MKNSIKSKSGKFFAGVLMTCLLTSATLIEVIAANPPSFAGNWKLNTSMSILGTEFSLAPQTMQVTQDANTLTLVKVVTLMGNTSTMNAKYTLDGVECKNQGLMESMTASKALWNEAGTALVINSTSDMQGQAIAAVEIYSIEDNRLKIVYSLDSPMGAFLETYVFDKQ